MRQVFAPRPVQDHMQRARRWTFTLNNPNEAEVSHLQELLESLQEPEAELESHVSYVVWGLEHAPSSGTPHLQGYIELSSLKSLQQMKTIISARAALFISKGTPSQNRTYCMKDGAGKEAGIMSKQGKRSDLLLIQALIEDGATEKEIATTYFSTWVRNRNSFRAYRDLIRGTHLNVMHSITTFPPEWPRVLNEKVTILWGSSGIGKTSYAKALLPKALMVSHMDDLRHFKPGEHDGIIFDDMDFKHLPRTSQIHLVDTDDTRSIHCRYDVASIPAGTKKIFTTNEHEGNIFLLSDSAIRRRVKVRHVERFDFN